LKRGDLVTIAASGPYTGKPRPALIIQSDAFVIGSVTLCLVTSDPFETPLFRVRIEATEANQLRQTSWIMVDKITTVRQNQIGRVISRLSPPDMSRVNEALAVFLDLTERDPASVERSNT
jgi:mRNA interferase MazF